MRDIEFRFSISIGIGSALWVIEILIQSLALLGVPVLGTVAMGIFALLLRDFADCAISNRNIESDSNTDSALGSDSANGLLWSLGVLVPCRSLAHSL